MRIQKEWVKECVSKMRNGKAAVPPGVIAEMMRASGERGIELVTILASLIMKEGAISKDW